MAVEDHNHHRPFLCDPLNFQSVDVDIEVDIDLYPSVYTRFFKCPIIVVNHPKHLGS